MPISAPSLGGSFVARLVEQSNSIEMLSSTKLLPRTITNLQTLRHLNSLTPSSSTTNKDAYFALIHHITNIVRRDIYPERTLNRLNLPVNSDLVFRVLRACSHSPSESFRFFTWARAHYSPTSVEYEELVKTLARAKRYASMWKLITQMKVENPKFSISSDTVCSIIQEYGKHGLIDQAVEWEVEGGTVFLDEMSKMGFNPPVRGRDMLIEGLLNAGYLESAKQMVTKMTKVGFVPDVNTFNSLIEAICKAGEVDFCVDIYHGVCKLGLCPDINTYKILIPAVSKVGRIDEAFRLLHNLIEDGHRPFPSLYAPIIKGMFRRGQFDDAFCFFSEMKVKGHPPNRPVYTMLITMCGRGGRYVEAANYLVEMTEMGLTPISRCFDMVTDGLKNCGKHDLAKRIEQLEVSLCSV
ncbi:hypothetical protein GH714_022671 [Hevea brasiliensis]|uniref:Pentacotripeptide-repeat region of PRORP domain-containing protein n=1 Tax=Hevea brasiliensis TaxID=3981 RepID=A0A6A6KWN9_HEVBR|nr:hypothetical protein GH714_022671 [Hevea brasiliensis]